MIYIYDNNLINKSETYLLSSNGTKVHEQKTCDSPLNNLRLYIDITNRKSQCELKKEVQHL